MTFASILIRAHYHRLHLGEVSTYNFSGDVTTFVGAAALFTTPLLLYWIFRSYWNSPLRK